MRTLQHTMRTTSEDNSRSKSIFQLSGEELSVRLSGTAIKVIRESWSKGNYITYFDATLCPDEKHMIHEYRDRKELVFIGQDGVSHFVKTL
jgi:hypothetical protein